MSRLHRFLVTACCCGWLSIANPGEAQDRPTERASQDLSYPIATTGMPAAGAKVAVKSAEYQGTDVHHMLYLPKDWSEQAKLAGKQWPVIVEYAGNYFPASGSTGEVEDSRLGYGICRGHFIWVTLPFISNDRRSNQRTWWGDVDATIEYAVSNVPRICAEYGGDPASVFLCGFSRGAIATSYIGLHNDMIAKLWCGFITHDHFDGVKQWKGTSWGYPLDKYRRDAATRLARIVGRPLLVCQSGGTADVREYLTSVIALESVDFVDVDPTRILGPFPNQFAIAPHTDGWLAKDSPERRRVWDWIAVQAVR